MIRISICYFNFHCILNHTHGDLWLEISLKQYPFPSKKTIKMESNTVLQSSRDFGYDRRKGDLFGKHLNYLIYCIDILYMNIFLNLFWLTQHVTKLSISNDKNDNVTLDYFTTWPQRLQYLMQEKHFC